MDVVTKRTGNHAEACRQGLICGSSLHSASTIMMVITPESFTQPKTQAIYLSKWREKESNNVARLI